jgi:diguanylate cyclase (GGDEF)-like protein
MWDKLLLVERSEGDRGAVKRALKGIFNVYIEVSDAPDAITAFVKEKPGFIIAAGDDAPGGDLGFISTIRDREDGKDIPIMILSVSTAMERKIEAFDIGASDYLTKPFVDDELLARVRSFLRVRDTIDGLKKKNALLEELVLTDALTCLYNRRHFFEAAREQMALGLRHNFKVACLIIDIDHFKQINDTYGHLAGDDIIIKVGGLLNSIRREGELLARYGGDEFVICLFNTDSEKALLAAERFRKQIKVHEFKSPHYPDMRLTVSMGLSIYPQDHITNIDELMKAADKALYRSKRDGRDRVTMSEH